MSSAVLQLVEFAADLSPGAPEWELAGASLGLPAQEARLAALVAQGRCDKQIAREMRLGFGTVRTYLSRAFERTGTGGRTELATLLLGRVMAMRKRAEGQHK